jgi:hypothetical protein
MTKIAAYQKQTTLSYFNAASLFSLANLSLHKNNFGRDENVLQGNFVKTETLFNYQIFNGLVRMVSV